MPSRPQSINIPAKTPGEEMAQAVIRWVALGISIAIGSLQAAHQGLPDPLDAESMGEGRAPESLTFSLRGAIECCVADHLTPAQRVLEEAAAETPERLYAEWQARQEGKG